MAIRVPVWRKSLSSVWTSTAGVTTSWLGVAEILAPRISLATEATLFFSVGVGVEALVDVGVVVGLGVGVEVGVGVGVGTEVGVAVGTGVGVGVGVGIAAVRASTKVFDSPEELVLLPEKRLNFTS